MVRVAVSILGTQELPADAFRRAVARLSLRAEIFAVGPVIADETIAVQSVVARVEQGLAEFADVLQRLGGQGETSFHLLSYGSLVYQSETVDVPPKGIENLRPALESLAAADPGFEIPGLGNIVAHLGLVSDRR